MRAVCIVLAIASCKSEPSSRHAAGSAGSARSTDLATIPIAPDPDGVFDQLFPLGKAPAIPAAFGGLRPWMPMTEGVAAAPAEWDGKSSRVVGKVRWRYDTDVKYHRVDELEVWVARDDLRHRLIAAWGSPFTHHPDDGIRDERACWPAPASRIRACHARAAAGAWATDVVELQALQVLDETLGAASPVAPEKLAGYLGKTRAEIRAAFADVIEDTTLSKTNPSLVHPLIGSEYRMSWLPDTLEIYFVEDKVTRVVLAFECEDKARAVELRERVTAAAKRAEGPGHLTQVAGWEEAGTVSIVVAQPE